MGFSINSNIGGMDSYNHLKQNTASVNKSLNSLSSALKINKAADNPANLALANQLLAESNGLGQSIMNANESIGMIQTADGALQEYDNILERVNTLTIQASNGTQSDSTRGFIQQEIDALMESANDIATTTSFNGKKLLDGTGGDSGNGTFITHTGANSGETQSVTIGDMRVNSLLLAPIDVTTQAGAEASMSTVQDAMVSVDTVRAELGASQNKLESTIRNISVTQVNIASAESMMRDVDFAAESANFSKLNIQSLTGSFAQSQSNAAQANVLNLFR